MKAGQVRDLMESLADAIEKVKLELNDPYIIVGGDFNKKDVTALDDFPDIKIRPSDPTRKDAVLDRIATNIEEANTTIRDPLESEEGRKSDHSVVTVEAKLPRLHQYTTSTFQTRVYSTEAEEKFGGLLMNVDWETISGRDPSETAEKLDNILQSMVNECFPLVTRTVRSSDAPWITKRIKSLIRNRKRIFKKQGRSALWRKKKKELDLIIA